ncbi:hypothetical protein [Methylobacterium ajmalii]|uniref:hypothetical protein n=1 Tax=Methylobacterium ajmalii TaxID=2738439 RepID=UPI002F35BE76
MTKPTGRPRGRPRKDATPPPAVEPENPPTDPNEMSGDQVLDALMAKPVPRGRRALLSPDDETLRIVGELAKLFATQIEVAAVLGVSRRTFQNFLDQHEEAREVWENGMGFAKISLRRKQLMLADKNAPAAIFLGKNYLGQKDEHHTTNTNVSMPAAELTDAQLMEIAQNSLKETTAASRKVH